MTTAARGTSARLGSLTVPAIAPVLAVWPSIGRAQSASTEVLSKVRDACIEMFHITSFLQQSPRQGEGRLYYSADSGDQTTPWTWPSCCRQANGDAQDASQIERLRLVPLKNPIQGLTARVLEYEDRPPFVTSKRQRLGCPRGIEFGCERVFVLEPPETLR